jgi:chromosome segregation ATPase
MSAESNATNTGPSAPPAPAPAESTDVVDSYHQLLQDGVRLQKELEAYYLRQEAYIRNRVAVLDEMQENIADERRCLEIQHQECRAQISAARKQSSGLLADEQKVMRAVQHAQPSLLTQEDEIDRRLAELQREKEAEDAALMAAMAQQESLQEEEARMASCERQKQREEEELQRALTEMAALHREMEERKKSLLRKHETVAQWDRTLESRERELTRCQDQLQEELKALESDETALGIHPMQRHAVTPAVSQRTVMDDHDMSIEHDGACEEIDYEV